MLSLNIYRWSSAIWRWTSKAPACYIRLSLPATRNSAQQSSPPHRLAFSDWGNILYNTTIATAIADRLVENSEVFLLGGDSFRKQNKDSSN